MTITQQQALEALERVYYATHASFIDRNLVRQYIEQSTAQPQAVVPAQRVPPEFVVLRELVEADKAWRALHPIHRLYEVEKGETQTRLAAAWKAAREYVAAAPQAKEQV